MAELVGHAAARAYPPVGDLLIAQRELDQVAGSGYHECISPAGTVLLKRGGRPFAPDTDLVNPALQLVDVLELDHYRVDGATMATEIPYEWLAPVPAARRVNRRVTGSAQINAQPYPKTSTSRCAPPGCPSDRPETVR